MRQMNGRVFWGMARQRGAFIEWHSRGIRMEKTFVRCVNWTKFKTWRYVQIGSNRERR